MPTGRMRKEAEIGRCNEQQLVGVKHNYGAWLGSEDGLFYMHWSWLKVNHDFGERLDNLKF